MNQTNKINTSKEWRGIIIRADENEKIRKDQENRKELVGRVMSIAEELMGVA